MTPYPAWSVRERVAKRLFFSIPNCAFSIMCHFSHHASTLSWILFAVFKRFSVGVMLTGHPISSASYIDSEDVVVLQVHLVPPRNISGYEDVMRYGYEFDQDEMLNEEEPLQKKTSALVPLCENRLCVGEIRNMEDHSLCVGIADRRRRHNNDIHMKRCDGPIRAPNQQWVFFLDGTIRNLNSGSRRRYRAGEMCWQQSSGSGYLHRVECAQGNPYQIFSQRSASRSDIDIDNNLVPQSLFLLQSSVNQNCVGVSRRRARLGTVPCVDTGSCRLCQTFYFRTRGKVIGRGLLVNAYDGCAGLRSYTYGAFVVGITCTGELRGVVWTAYENGEIVNDALGECMGRGNDQVNDPARTIAMGPCDNNGHTFWRMKEVDTGGSCTKYQIISDWRPSGPSDGCLTRSTALDEVLYVSSCISPATPGPFGQQQLWSVGWTCL